MTDSSLCPGRSVCGGQGDGQRGPSPAEAEFVVVVQFRPPGSTVTVSRVIAVPPL